MTGFSPTYRRLLAVMLIGMALTLTPGEASAQAIDLDTCAPGVPQWMLTTKVVYCVQQTVINAVFAFVNQLTAVMVPTVAAMFCVSLIFFGLRITSMEKRAPPVSFAFMMRWTIVMFFSYYMSMFVAFPFALVEELLRLVTGGWSPWVQIDLAMGRLMGFGPNIALFQGLLGLVGAVLFSSSVGAYVFLAFGLALLMVFGMIYRAVYTYLVAIVLMAFIMVISPLMVPLAVFQRAERYTKKWLDLLIATILQPMLLFAFLWVFLGVIDIYIGAIFGMLGGNNFLPFWRQNAPLFSWIMINDPALFNQVGAQVPQQNPNAPLIQAFLSPLLSSGMDFALINSPNVNFGAQNINIMQGLIGQFLALGIVAYTLKSIIEHIPHLADDIAGVYTAMKFERLQFIDNLKKALSQVGGT